MCSSFRNFDLEIILYKSIRGKSLLFRRKLALGFLALLIIVNAKAQSSSWEKLNSEGLAYYQSGNLEMSLELLEKALNQAVKEFGLYDVSYAKACFNLSILYEDLGDYSKAEPYCIRAKELFEIKLGKTDPFYLEALNNLANLYESTGDYSKAEQFYNEKLQLDEVAGNKETQSYASTCNSLGVLYLNQGYYKKAESRLLEALEIRAKFEGEASFSYGITCRNLAGLYQSQGLYSDAEILFIRYRDIVLNIKGKQSISYATVCNSLGRLYMVQGNYVKAESMHLEAKEIREMLMGKNHEDYAISCISLGELYFQLENYPKAKELYLEAKQIREKLLGKQHPLYAATCASLAQVYLALEDYGIAEPMYLEAISINTKIQGRYNLTNAIIYNDLGALYTSRMDFKKAENILLEAREIYSKVVGINNPDYATMCQNLAVLFISQKDLSKAEPLFREVKNIQLDQIDKNFKTLSEKEQQFFFTKLSEYLDDYTSFALAYYYQSASITKDIYDLRLATKGLLFNSTQKTRIQIINSGDSSLINKFELLTLKRNYLADQHRLIPENELNQGISGIGIDSEVNALEKEVTHLAEKYNYKLGKEKRSTWQDIKAKLKKGEAAIEIIRARSYEIGRDTVYAALLITIDTKDYPELVLLADGAAMEGRGINYYRNCILNQIDDDYSYNLFWRPLAEKLKGIDKVYLSPDGIYYQINLATLRNPVSETYLLEELKVRVVNSSRDIIEPTKVSKSNKGYLFGFPNYTGNETIGKIRPLPGTMIEVKNIHRLLQRKGISSTIFTGNEASEKNLKEARNPRFLHIATHGFFVPDLNRENRSEPSTQIFQNPLFRSGLLLAGCESNVNYQKGDDGTLTAYEAMNLFLDETDLVVLSACETGLGVIQNGEGVYGLNRAFQQAGAKTIVFSLWKVSDSATELLMTTLYTEYLRTNNLEQSFIVAQNIVREEFPQPYYWGAFIMVGR